MVKELTLNKSNEKEIRESYLYLKFITGTCINILFVMYILLTSNTIAVYATPLMLTLIFQGMDFIELSGQVTGNSKRVVKINIISLVFSSIIKIIFIVTEMDLSWFLMAMSLDYIVLLLTYALYQKKSFQQFQLLTAKHIEYIKYLLKKSWPLFLSSASVIIYMKIDTLMLFSIVGSNDAGLYSASVRLSELAYFIPSIMLTGLFPLLIEKHKEGYKAYSEIASLYILVLFFSAIIYVLVVGFYTEEIINLVYGPEYSPAAPILLIHVFSTIPVYLGVVYRKMAIIDNFQKITLFSTLIGCALNVILNYIFIPFYGMEGAAWATFISRFVSSILLYYLFIETRFFLNILLGGFNPYLIKRAINAHRH